MTTRRELLARVPLFAAFEDRELAALEALLEPRRVARGAVVCKEGSPGDTFCVVASGELEVSTGEPPRVVNRLVEGDSFGELALLLGGVRTATVTAARSSQLLEFRKEHFDRVLRDHPKVLDYLARAVSKRLADAHRPRPPARRSTAVAVIGEPGVRGKSVVAASVAALLASLAQVEVLLVRVAPKGRAPKRSADLEKVAVASPEELSSLVRAVGDGLATLDLAVARDVDEGRATDLFSALLERAKERFAWVVVDLGGEPASLPRAAEQFAHRVVELSSSERARGEGANGRYLRVLNRYDPRAPALPINSCEPFVLPVDGALEGETLEAARSIVANRRTPAAVPLRRLARKLLGTTVGMALGGGAAFGIAHVGVLEVFEREDITVDLVAGTSMGSIVALGYAAGLSGAEMHEIALRIGNVRTTLSALDFTLTQPGLLAGNRLMAIFLPFLSKRDFSELVVPCRTVATDIESGECVQILNGRLDLAFRASSSVPVLWSPLRHLDRVLVDGAIVNPVPVDVAREMGADFVIGVNVVPSLKRGVSTAVARAFRAASWLNPLSYLGGAGGLPSLFDVTMNSIQQLQHELGKFRGISADVQITPDLSDFTWIEFYRPKELIERGARAAEEAVPRIRQALAERASAG